MLLTNFISATTNMNMQFSLCFETTTLNKLPLCVYGVTKEKSRINLLVSSKSENQAITLGTFYTFCLKELPQMPIYIYDTYTNISYPIFGYRIEAPLLLLK